MSEEEEEEEEEKEDGEIHKFSDWTFTVMLEVL